MPAAPIFYLNTVWHTPEKTFLVKFKVDKKEVNYYMFNPIINFGQGLYVAKQSKSEFILINT